MAEAWEECHLQDTQMSTFYKSLPVALLAVPSVKHFCQSTEFGPLALRSIMYADPGHLSIEVLTCHFRHPGRDQGLKRNFAPIMSGAINRYYYLHDPTTKNVNVLSEDIAGQAMTASLVTCFYGWKIDIVGRDMKPLKRSTIENDPLQGTVVELYGLCPEDLGLTRIQEAQTEASRTYLTREEMQEILDDHLSEIWKGKVFLKKKADAPPCTACGRKLMDE